MQTTQLSLIARLSDPDDEEAWLQFTSLYEPAIVRAFERFGLQHADAQDEAQRVFLGIAKSLAKRPHNPQKAKFRTWLARLIKNAAINALKKKPLAMAQGGSSAHQALQTYPEASAELVLDDEVTQQIFKVAAKRVEAEFESATWQAFYLSTVENIDIQEVANQLGKQRGAVYAARSRVVARLRREVEQIRRELEV